jgi:MFS family permease
MAGAAVQTDIPARMDRLPWSRVHLLIVVALGITWILDGLEVTFVGSIAPLLQDHRTLALTTTDIGAAASAYVAGAVLGALSFGWLTDRSGRRLVFNLTLLSSPRRPSISTASRSAACSPVLPSVANIQQSTRPSTN